MRCEEDLGHLVHHSDRGSQYLAMRYTPTAAIVFAGAVVILQLTPTPAFATPIQVESGTAEIRDFSGRRVRSSTTRFEGDPRCASVSARTRRLRLRSICFPAAVRMTSTCSFS
jgi:hypothetical protein